MPLDYTCDVELIVPREVFSDPVCRDVLARVGVQADSRGNKVMLFTDPRTVAALRAADERITDVFAKSGYGFKPWEDAGQVAGRAAFLRSEFQKIGQILAERNMSTVELERRVFDLLRFADACVRGTRTDAQGYPMVSEAEMARLLRLPVTEPFDIRAAMEASLAQAVAAQNGVRPQDISSAQPSSVASPIPGPQETPTPPQRKGLLRRLFH